MTSRIAALSAMGLLGLSTPPHHPFSTNSGRHTQAPTPLNCDASGDRAQPAAASQCQAASVHAPVMRVDQRAGLIPTETQPSLRPTSKIPYALTSTPRTNTDALVEPAATRTRPSRSDAEPTVAGGRRSSRGQATAESDDPLWNLDGRVSQLFASMDGCGTPRQANQSALQAGGRRFDPGWLHRCMSCFHAHHLLLILDSSAHSVPTAVAGRRVISVQEVAVLVLGLANARRTVNTPACRSTSIQSPPKASFGRTPVPTQKIASGPNGPSSRARASTSSHEAPAYLAVVASRPARGLPTRPDAHHGNL